MKKVLLIILIYLLSILYINVDALNLGYSTDSDYDGAYVIKENATFAILDGAKHTLIVNYDNMENLGKITIDFSLSSDVSISSNNSELGSGDTLTGSGNSYTININSETQNPEGLGLFVVSFPRPASTTEYTVNYTAKAYDKSDGLMETKNGRYKYIVFVKPKNCENNTGLSISSSDGSVSKVSNILYKVDTSASSISLTISKDSSKTDIYYWGYGSENSDHFLNDGKKLDDGKINNISVDYGITQLNISLDTECSKLGKENLNKLDSIDYETMIGFESGSAQEQISDYAVPVIISINRDDTRSKINTLSSLSITDVDIDFKSELRSYVASVPYKINRVTISSKLTDSKSSYVSGYGNRTVDLKEGNNTLEIKVKAENGSEGVYTIKITREKNDDISLKELKVNDKEIIIKEDVLAYSVNVTNDIIKPIITAIATDEKAKVEIDNIEELLEGSNKINIVVTASNGSKGVYELEIVRDKLISENSYLRNIEVKGYELDFDKDKLEYSIKIGSDVDQLDLNIITDHEKAKYLVTGNKDLKNESIIKIKVTAEDEKTTTTYTIKIEKEKKKLNIFIIIIPIIIVFIIIMTIIILKNKKKKSIENVNNKQPVNLTQNDIVNIDDNSNI